MDRTAKLRSAQHTTASAVHLALNNPNGVALLEELRRTFPGRFHVDPAQHAFNAGQRDVVTWLEEKLDFKMEEA